MVSRILPHGWKSISVADGTYLTPGTICRGSGECWSREAVTQLMSRWLRRSGRIRWRASRSGHTNLKRACSLIHLQTASSRLRMTLLTVRHVTIYRYSKPVGLGLHRMMFRPRESHDLKLLKSSLSITPKPSHLRWLHDVFDNSIAIAEFEGFTTELRFESIVTLQHFETALPDYPLE